MESTYEALQRFNLTKSCKVLEPLCFHHHLDECNDNINIAHYANGISAFVIVINFISLAFMVWRYCLFWTYDFKIFSLKKLIFGCAITYNVLRIVRYAMMMGGSPYENLGVLTINLLFYQLAIGMIFSAYSFLLVFWIRICSKTQVNSSWMGNSKFVQSSLFISNFLFYVFLILAAVNTIMSNASSYPIALVCLFFSIGYMIEGTKVYRTLKGIKFGRSSKKRNVDPKNDVLIRITVITISASTAWLIVTLVLIICAIIETKNYYGCQGVHLLYRVLELMLLLVITVPLSGYVYHDRLASTPEGTSSLVTLTTDKSSPPNSSKSGNESQVTQVEISTDGQELTQLPKIDSA